jgi:hypothetical protein
LQLLTDSDGNEFLRYTEDCSKSNQGGLKHRKVKRKVVDAYQKKKDRLRCIVSMYKKYVFHCPEKKTRRVLLKTPCQAKKSSLVCCTADWQAQAFPGGI